jgi:serine/threonine protein kinase
MKPSNLMIKNPYQHITIIDFGLCKRYIALNRHISMRKNKKLVGTPVFCSYNTHAGLGI